MNEFEIFKITYTVYLTNPTGLRDEDKGQVTPFDFHGSKPVEYYLHMIGHIPHNYFLCLLD